MAKIFGRLQELKCLPADLHWFCSLRNIDLHNFMAADGESIKTETSTAEGTEVLRELLYDCFQMFAYQSEDVVPHQIFLGQEVDKQLARCDLCIIEYYRFKHWVMEKLRHVYDDHEVTAFVKIIDDRDIARIKRGLEIVTQKLRVAHPKSRTKDILELSSQLSMFEALSCEAFLADYSLVRQHLEEPFKLVQSNRRFHVAYYVPAATIFLFDPDEFRSVWARQTWSKYRTRPSREDFDFAIRDPLLRNLTLASAPLEDANFLQPLWCGIGLIVNQLDSDLITHSLRAMDVDVFRLALEHLQYKTPGLRFLLQSIQKLLEIAPTDFWESMGAISPTTIIEQIFNNPQYDRFVVESGGNEDYEYSALKDLISWIRPFMASLQDGHQPQACRAIAFQLMNRLQADRFPTHAKLEFYRTGLGILSWTLGNCIKGNTTFEPVRRIIAADMLEVISTYIKRILAIPSLPANDPYNGPLTEHCLTVVRLALALECKSLRTGQEALMNNEELPPGFSSYSPAVWDAVVHKLDYGNITVARAALIGINDLIGLEKFKSKGDEAHAKEKSEFNVTFGHLTHLVCQMLERINDFNPTDLDKLFRHSDTATALVASLFSADASTYEAGVNLIKNISLESARKEAIGHLLLPFFETTLNSFSWSIRRIAQKRTFSSCPRMLKTCTDVLDVLCDSQTGLLRTRVLSGLSEIKAIENFWKHQWEALKVIYEMTEDWSRRGTDSSLMKEFCRDTMQFSERFFDQYSVFASAIDTAVVIKEEHGRIEDNSNTAGKMLLKYPAMTMEAMIKWLRLRDTYLAGTSLKLTKKVLGRLSEWEMIIAEGSCRFLERVVLGGAQARTKLTPQEKAELARALEANIGRPLTLVDIDSDASKSNTSSRARARSGQGQYVPSSTATAKKTRPGTIDLAAWSSKARKPPEVIEIPDEDEYGDSDILDQDILSVSRSVEMLEEQRALRGHGVTYSQTRSRNLASGPGLSQKGLKGAKDVKTEAQLQIERTIFRDKREKEREAKKKRDTEMLAKVKKNIPLIGVAEQTLGEGSGLGSIGIKGKDHAPKGTGMMVSSGSESDSEGELDRELFGSTSRTPKVSNALKGHHANQLQQAKAYGPVKKARQVRSAKDMRARLAPDLASLHRTILSWDFFHKGDFPPNTDRNDYSLVTSTFRNPLEYQSTFEPLLVLEAWQGFLKSKEEGNSKSFEIKVANRLTVDSFVELSTTISIAEAKELAISEADVVLMSKSQSPTTDRHQPHCLARIYKINRKKTAFDISYRVNVGNPLIAAMVPNSILRGTRILSMTPLEREFGALQGLKFYDLCDEIIKAKPSPLLSYSDKQLERLVVNYSINSAQAKAVRSAIDNDAFTLIQGPPGSGKTKTIVAIVGALVASDRHEIGVKIARPQAHSANTASPAGSSPSKKLLICAPSNAAVDELVMRLKQGVKSVNGEFHKLSVVRLGRSDVINANIKDVTLEELVNAKLNLVTEKKTGAGEDVHQIMMEHKATCEKFNAIRATLDAMKSKGEPTTPEQEHEFDVLKRKKQQLGNKIDSTRDSGNTAARDAEINRRKIQQEILDTAHVICATLSGSGHEMFQSLSIEFEAVIIDEAAQSIELSALIPLKYGCSKCILVGDPKQLPPTVLSREAARFQYEQSLFVRMQTNHPKDVHLLDTQYRMHPEISLFPSTAFYEGKLLDGPDMAKLRARPWHQDEMLGPYRFFDVQGSHQSAPQGHSLINVAEIEVALQLFNRLVMECKSYDFTGKVGIITPYKSQLRELRARFSQIYGESILTTVEFNTTDAFQGRESEVIIFSCVRASLAGGIGFLSDIRRMNVGITRAKSSLWVLGNSQSLMRGEFWRDLIKDARNRNRFTGGDVVGILRRPLVDIPKHNIKRVASQDIPLLDTLANESSRRSSTIRSPIDHVMEDVSLNMAPCSDIPSKKTNDDFEHMPYIPSGGFNGLNQNASCGRCGSFAHFAKDCNNIDAMSTSLGKCYRCGDVSHTGANCTVVKCTECGGTGHSSRMCGSKIPLSNIEKHKLLRDERKHRATLQRQPENQRRKQLGGHDKQVPTVQPTARTPPHASGGQKLRSQHQQHDLKRKREISPPLGAPRAPKRMVSAVNTGQPFTSYQTRGENDAIAPANLKRSLPLQSQSASGDSPRVDASGRISNSSKAVGPNATNMSHTLPAKPPSPRESLQATSNGLVPSDGSGPRDGGLRVNDPHLTHQQHDADDGKARGAQASLPTQQNARALPVRPPKKKKDASPFIIPKTKKH